MRGDVARADEAVFAAMQNFDAEVMGDLLAEDCIHLHSPGTRDTKISYLDKGKTGSFSITGSRRVRIGSTFAVMPRLARNGLHRHRLVRFRDLRHSDRRHRNDRRPGHWGLAFCLRQSLLADLGPVHLIVSGAPGIASILIAPRGL